MMIWIWIGFCIAVLLALAGFMVLAAMQSEQRILELERQARRGWLDDLHPDYERSLELRDKWGDYGDEYEYDVE